MKEKEPVTKKEEKEGLAEIVVRRQLNKSTMGSAIRKLKRLMLGV